MRTAPSIIMDFFAGDDSYFSATYELPETKDGPELQHGGSRPDRSPKIAGNLIADAIQLHSDYLSTNLTYPLQLFVRRYHIVCPQLFDICAKLEHCYEFFQTKTDAGGLVSFNSYQKATAALRLLAYGVSADSLAEYIRKMSLQRSNA